MRYHASERTPNVAGDVLHHEPYGKDGGSAASRSMRNGLHWSEPGSALSNLRSVCDAGMTKQIWENEWYSYNVSGTALVAGLMTG